RVLRPGRSFHVDPHEEPGLDPGVDDPAEVVDGRGAVDGQTDLGELDRQAATGNAGGRGGLDEGDVLARGRDGLLARRDAFAEQVDRGQQAARLELSHRSNRFGNGSAGDEPAGDAARAAQTVARGGLLQE